MPTSPSRPDPARGRRWHHIAGAGLAVTAAGALVLWAPTDRANVLVTLLGVVVTGIVGWRSSNRRGGNSPDV